MRWPPRTIRVRHAWLARFRRESGGAAVVEFALILPVMLLLAMGTIEGGSLITVDRRVNVISGTVGDLVSRWNTDKNGTLSSSTLNDYFKASQAIMYPYSTTALQQVVSLVEVAEDGETTVIWSCGYNGATARTADAGYPTLPANMNQLARGGYVVASEASYPYRPALGLVFTEAINLYQEGFYLPRYEKAIPGPASC